MKAHPKPRRERDEDYLKWIRAQKCAVSFGYTCSDVDAHHVRELGQGGIGTKPSDRRAIPLCREAHQNYHLWGRDVFERTYGIDIEALIARCNREYPGPTKEKKQRKKILIPHCICGKRHVLYSCPMEAK